MEIQGLIETNELSRFVKSSDLPVSSLPSPNLVLSSLSLVFRVSQSPALESPNLGITNRDLLRLGLRLIEISGRRSETRLPVSQSRNLVISQSPSSRLPFLSLLISTLWRFPPRAPASKSSVATACEMKNEKFTCSDDLICGPARPRRPLQYVPPLLPLHRAALNGRLFRWYTPAAGR